MGRVEENLGKHLTIEDLERRALTLQALGWLLLVVDGIIAVFVFVGIRSGSLLWLYWTVIEGAVGMLLVGAGVRLSQHAAEALGHELAPHVHGEEDRRVDHTEAA